MPGIKRGIWLTARSAGNDEIQGRGPILAQTWEDTAGLNSIGTFRAVVPAAHLRWKDTDMRGKVECWAIVGNEPKLVQTGIVMDRRSRAQGGEVFVEISGPTVGEELNFTLVHNLELTDPILVHPETAVHLYESTLPGVWFDVRLSAALDDDPTNHVFINNMDEAGYLYFGHAEMFYSVEFEFDPGDWNQTPGITWRAQLFNGGGWVEIDVEDGTVDAEGRTFHQNGAFTWDTGHNWTETLSFGHSLYYIRFWPSGAMDDFKIREIRVWTKGPKADDLAPIVEFAPGWSIAASGQQSTERGTFIQFSGETVMGALSKVAETSGEFFRINDSLRQIEWLGSTPTETGITLIRAEGSAPATNKNVAFITEIEKVEDVWDIVTKIIPYGAGNGPARLTMAEADVPILPPNSGWTYDFENNYLINGNARNEYGLIERIVTFGEIQIIRLDDYGRTAAANELFWAAYNWLAIHSAPLISYKVTVLDGARVFQPGDLVAVDFWDYNAAGNITFGAGQMAGSTGRYWTVVDVTQSFDGDGLRTSRLLLTNNVLRKVLYSGKTIYHRLEQLERMRAIVQRFPKDAAAAPVRTLVKPVIIGGKASAWEESITEALANHLQLVVDATE